MISLATHPIIGLPVTSRVNAVQARPTPAMAWLLATALGVGATAGPAAVMFERPIRHVASVTPLSVGMMLIALMARRDRRQNAPAAPRLA